MMEPGGSRVFCIHVLPLPQAGGVWGALLYYVYCGLMLLCGMGVCGRSGFAPLPWSKLLCSFKHLKNTNHHFEEEVLYKCPIHIF